MRSFYYLMDECVLVLTLIAIQCIADGRFDQAWARWVEMTHLD